MEWPPQSQTFQEIRESVSRADSALVPVGLAKHALGA